MADKIGQIRSGQLESFLTPLSFSLGEKVNSQQPALFFDPCLNISSSNELVRNKGYFLSFRIKQGAEQRTFRLKFSNENLETENSITIKKFTVERGTGYSYFNVVVSPSGSYKQIVIALDRIAQDHEAGKTYNLQASEVKLFMINNLLKNIELLYPSFEKIKAFGLQGTKGLKFSINGEELLIGGTGIYELRKEIDMIDFGFALTDPENQFFILDFKY